MPLGGRRGILSAAWLGCWLLAAILTHIPIKTSGPIRFDRADKVAHLSLYFVITYLGGLRLRSKSTGTSPGLLLVWACVYVAYAAVDELTQPFTGRDCDIMDWVFDALGVALATAAVWRGFVPRVWAPSGE